MIGIALGALGLAVCMLLGPATSAAAPFDRPPVQSDPALEALVDATWRRCIDFIYDGQLDSAMAVVEQTAVLTPGDPRIGLLRFRCLRENYPDDLNEEERAKRLVSKVIKPLDWTIAACDSLFVTDKKSEVGFLYRGWAQMMKAQVHAIASQFWPAGGESRRAKSDLDEYLKKHPKDGDAGVILGGYLYFADILPKVVKVIKFIARVPGGDRERGLAMLAAGREAGGYSAIDAEMLLAVIEYYFEGKIESSEAKFESLSKRFPYNLRVNELLGNTAIFHPEASVEAQAAQSRIIDGWGTRVRGWDQIFLYRILYARARVWNQMGDYEAAKADLERVVEGKPVEPFYLLPRSLLGLAQLAANAGDGEAAKGYAQRVLKEERWSRYYPAAKRFITLPVGKRQQEIAAALADVRRDVYGAEPNPERARARIKEVQAQHGDDARVTFLAAELARSQGDVAGARKGYEQVVSSGTDSGFESSRLMSLIRLGELDLAAKKYGEAMHRYEEAQEIESGNTHLGNMIRGRMRYIEEASHTNN
ncbi:MAG TPA: tetratricopeptide repeat protein [Candidatus Udaeobacter sp.]|nr:tetratricopeptide repeat protein [Candidatus Udaeobacter sp.]